MSFVREGGGKESWSRPKFTAPSGPKEAPLYLLSITPILSGFENLRTMIYALVLPTSSALAEMLELCEILMCTGTQVVCTQLL